MIGSPELASPDAACDSDELRLRVVGTEHDGRILRIRSAKCTIGSAAGCTLRLRAPGVAGVHCLIVRGPDGLVVRSWSKHTRLNGRAFSDAGLSVGDRLTIGPLELEILASPQRSSPSPAVAQPPAPLTTKALDVDQQLAQREAHIAELNLRLSEAERLVEAARQEASAAVSATPVAPSEPTEELLALRQQVENLERECVAKATECAEWQQRLVSERDQVDTLTRAVQQLQSEAQAAVATWQHEREQLNAELHRAQHNSSITLDKQRELREMEVALTHWRERSDELTRQLADAQRQLAEHAVADGNDPDQQALRAELEAGARELDAEAERLLRLEEELQKREQALETEKARLQSELDAQQAKLSEREAALAEQEAQLAQQETRLAEQESDLLEQQAILADAQEAFRLEQQRASSPAAPPAAVPEEEQPETDHPAEAPKAAFQASSASDIIAKLSASGLWKDDIPEDTSAEETSCAPEPAWKSLVSEAERTPPPAPIPAAPAEEEDSIEAYMQRLLLRVSGDAEAPARPSASHALVVETSTTSKQVEEAAEETEEVQEEPFDPSTYVPRSTAPELTSNLAAMRELANSSARTAIDTSSKRRQARHAIGKVVMSLAAIGTAGGLWYLTRQTHSVLSYYASLSAGAAACIWGLHALSLWIRARRKAAQERLDR